MEKGKPKRDVYRADVIDGLCGERGWQSEQGNLGWLRGFLISQSLGREKGK